MKVSSFNISFMQYGYLSSQHISVRLYICNDTYLYHLWARHYISLLLVYKYNAILTASAWLHMQQSSLKATAVWYPKDKDVSSGMCYHSCCRQRSPVTVANYIPRRFHICATLVVQSVLALYCECCFQILFTALILVCACNNCILKETTKYFYSYTEILY